jgi:starch synthase (maltosyl-transferring)
VVNLNPHETRDTFVHLWMPAIGLDWDTGPFEVHDELTGQTWTWHGSINWVRLDPHWEPAHVLHVRRR